MAKDSTGTAQAAEPLVCTKCGERPRGAGHDWCRECKAEKQRDYVKTKDGMLESRGFAKGVAAFRRMCIGEFVRLGNAHFAGFEVAHLLTEAKAPELAESPDV